MEDETGSKKLERIRIVQTLRNHKKEGHY